MDRNPGHLRTASGLAAIVLWSTTFALARSLSEQIGPITAGAAVYLTGGAFGLLRFAGSREGRSRFVNLSRLYLFACGSLFVLYTAAVYLAVGLAKDRTQLLEIALLNYLWPLLTILFSLPVLKKRASLWLVPGTVFALIGLFLVMMQDARGFWVSWWNNPAPYGLALTAAIFWALYSTLTRRWSGPKSSGAVEFFITGSGLVLFVMRLLVTEPARWSPQAVGEIVGLAAVTALAYSLWDVSMRKGNLLLVVACSYLTPLLSTSVSCLYLGLFPSARLWIGCLLLVLGSLISWRSVTDGPA